MKIVIIMGSKADLDWSKKIVEALKEFGLSSVCRIASAHKVPLKCLDIIREYEKEGAIFITVAGRSNALSGFTDAQTVWPVIACPPYSEKFSGFDIFSTLRMPSGVAPLVVLEPENAALAAAKIVALVDPEIRKKVEAYQEKMRRKLEEDDANLGRF
ncbi:MAG: AIR carboxylase family protein [Candidatus Aminicenantes bacterium]|nr:AIR carboxylase family protein [Candidatus Aminicenantes bacterium]